MEVLRNNNEQAIRHLRRSMIYSVVTYLIVITFLAIINRISTPGYLWVIWPALGWGLGLLLGIIGKYKTIDRLKDEQ